MKRYEAYKDSGVEWIGEVPEHWKAVRLKYIVKSVGTGSTPPSDDIRYYQNGTISWYGPGDFKQLVLNSAKRKITQQAVIDRKSKLFPKGTILLVGIGATVGKIGLVQEESSSNQQVNAIEISDENNSMFYTYFLSSIKEIIVSEAASATLPIFNQSHTKNLWVPLPPLKEQTLIANYLDHKTKQLDELIASKQRLIDLLEEERTATINHAVTKGINPDAPLKDSGIEWLGEIPEHWEVKKLKYLADVVLGKMLTKEDKGGYFKKSYLRSKNINWLQPDITDVKSMWFSQNEIKQYRIKTNDLLVSEGGEVGRTCIWSDELEECYIQNSVHKVTIEDGSPIYFLHQFGLFGQLGHFDAIVNRISIAHLTKEKLSNVSFVFPPESEQEVITKYLVNEQSRLDTKEIKLEQEINLLKEYKTTLISDVVTGKVDVREEVVD